MPVHYHLHRETLKWSKSDKNIRHKAQKTFFESEKNNNYDLRNKI